MSYTSLVKQEIMSLSLQNNPALSSRFQGICLFSLKYHRNLNGQYVTFTSYNYQYIMYIIQVVNFLYRLHHDHLEVKTNPLTRHRRYTISYRDDLGVILQDNQAFEPLSISDVNNLDEQVRKEIMVGAFLAHGTLCDPHHQNYHLEFTSERKNPTLFLQAIINSFNLNSKIIDRRGKYMLYLKSSVNIKSFLYLIGAMNTYLELETFLTTAEFRTKIKRQNNIGIANNLRAMENANEEMNWIDYIHTQQIQLPEKLEQVAKLREQFPEETLGELCDLYRQLYGQGVSRSTLSRRLNELKTYCTGL